MSRLQQDTVSVGTKVSLEFIRQQFSVRKFRWLILAFFTIANRLVWIAVIYQFKIAIDAFTVNDIETAKYRIILAAIIFCLKMVLVPTRTYFHETTNALLANESSSFVMRELIKKDASFFENRFSGTLARAVQSIASKLEGILNKILWNIAPFLVSTIAAITGIWFIYDTISIVMLFFIGLFITLVARQYRIMSESIVEKVEKDEQDFSGAVNDTFTNIQTVSLFGTSKHELSLFDQAASNLLASRFVEARGYTKVDVIAGIVYSILYVVVTILMIVGWKNGLITVGDMLFIQSQMVETLDGAWGFSYAMSEINTNLATIGQTVGLMNEQAMVQSLPEAKILKVKKAQITLSNIAFSYKSGTNALKGIDTIFEAGKSYALVGHSGAGKSTFIKLLLRMYDPTKGEILIDGQNIKNVTLESLRSSIAYVPQDPALFHRSILDNIRYAKPKASRNEVIAAAKLAQCHEFVSKLKNGYDTVVGERGAKLSGGERQRVAIARAILKNAPILLLDEATSSLDSESEYLVQKALENLMKNRTSIVIAHRLSTIKRADKILVIEKGVISDTGTHDELLARPGVYKNLWERQSGARI